MLYGRELGLGPMQSLNMIQSIKGRVGLKPEAMRALVRSQGHQIWVKAQSNDSITMCGHRKEDPQEVVVEVTWSMDDAKRAQLSGAGNWQKYPRAMLTARCTAELCRLHFADVIGGLSYTPEELAEMPSIEAEVVEPGPAEPVDVKRAKGVLMDAIRRQGWPYEQGSRDCPAVVEAARAWGDREGITVGELNELCAGIAVYREVEDVDRLAAQLSGGEGGPAATGTEPPQEGCPAVDVSASDESAGSDGAVASAGPGSGSDGPAVRAADAGNGDAGRPFDDGAAGPVSVTIGSDAGRTLHVDLARAGVAKKSDQEAFILCASNGRTARASALVAEEASRVLFFADSVKEGRMSMADIVGAAAELVEGGEPRLPRQARSAR
jgi:hypothetical protein